MTHQFTHSFNKYFTLSIHSMPSAALGSGGRVKSKTWGFPGGSVATTLGSQCRGPRFDPWSGNYIPRAITKDPIRYN